MTFDTTMLSGLDTGDDLTTSGEDGGITALTRNRMI